jgi:hypothetical protein
MPNFHVAEAFDYYDKHIYRADRFAVFRRYGFSLAGSVPSVDWEVFGAILTGDQKRSGYGSDLIHLEVKSAIEGSSFEYQYHKEHGEEKLDEDKSIGHLFISYAADYRDVTVRYVSPEVFAPIFEAWREGYRQRYASGGQRYRKSISYGLVVSQGEMILKIRSGDISYP